MAEYKSGLNNATKQLGQYFGVMSKDDFMGKLIAMTTLDVPTGTPPTTKDIQTASVETTIGQIFLDATEGAFFTKDIIEQVDNFLKGDTEVANGAEAENLDAGEAKKIKELFDILYEPGTFGSYAKAQEACAMTHPENTHESGPDMKTPASMMQMVGGLNKPADTGVNQADSAPTSDKPSLAAYMIKHARLSPAHRDCGAIEVFMNMIPTHEISRCVPYLDIQFIYNKAPVDDKRRPTGMSIYTFLQGRKSMVEDSLDMDIVGAFPKDAASSISGFEFGTEGAEGRKMSYAGMELFTTPQSMINADEPHFEVFQDFKEKGLGADGKPNGTTTTTENALGGPRSAPIIDKMRPFASVDGLSIDVSPVGGMMCHKTAQMTITLHDRSRLGDISELVQPALWGNTHMILDYGWSHPDGGPASTNAIGQFLNALRVKEKYHVVNSSFKFDEAGQCIISLKLGMLGEADLDKAGIGTDTEVKKAHEEIDKLTQVIRDMVSKISGESGGNSKSITGGDWIGKVTSSSGALNIDAKTMRAIARFIAQGKARAPGDPYAGNGPTGDALREAINELVGTKADGSGGYVGKLKERVSKIVEARKKLLTDPGSGDPFFRVIGTATPEDPVARTYVKVMTPATYTNTLAKKLGKPRYRTAKVKGDTTGKKFVSFGKVMSLFVGQPLASGGAYDEVQLFFYAFNPYASYLKDHNIASFPIDVKRFTAELDRITETEADITLRRFLGFINSKFIGEQSSHAWGMADYYRTNNEGNRVLTSKTLKATQLYDKKQDRLKDAYKDANGKCERDLTFKPPRLGVFMEAVPVHKASATGSADTATEQLSILRVHIYDKQCNVYEGIGEMLTAARNTEMGALNNVKFTVQDGTSATTQNADKSGFNEIWTAQRDAAEKFGIIEAIGAGGAGGNVQDAKELNDGNTYFRISGGFPSLKAFIKSTMPSMTYGTQNSAILKANLSSQNNPALTTIHLMRGGAGSAESSVISGDRGVPLKISPTTLDLDIIGCPIMRYGQSFFIDFGTGTTADNVYVVNGISHKLGPGEFTTQLKMVQYDTFGRYDSMLKNVMGAMAKLQQADEQAAG